MSVEWGWGVQVRLHSPELITWRTAHPGVHVHAFSRHLVRVSDFEHPFHSMDKRPIVEFFALQLKARPITLLNGLGLT